MNENELFKQVMKEHYLDKEQIRKNAMCVSPVPKPNMKGTVYMKKRISALVFVAIFISLSAVTIFAVNTILNPKEVVKMLEYPKVAEAFEASDSIKINKTVTENGYTVALLGIASGKNLGMFVDDIDKSYAVIAISNSDGSDIINFDTPLFISPLIKGLNPGLFNIATLNGGYTERVFDGIRYRMIECDSIEMFADRGIYLCVTDNTFYDSNAFSFDKDSGIIVANSDYAGLNILFDLPIDKTKADFDKAQSYVDAVFAPKVEDESENDSTSHMDVPKTDAGDVDIQEIMKSTNPIEDSRQTIKLDADERFRYSYTASNGSYIKTSRSLKQVKDFKVGEPFIHDISSSSDNKAETTWYLILTMQSDDTIEAVIYESVKTLE